MLQLAGLFKNRLNLGQKGAFVSETDHFMWASCLLFLHRRLNSHLIIIFPTASLQSGQSAHGRAAVLAK